MMQLLTTLGGLATLFLLPLSAPAQGVITPLHVAKLRSVSAAEISPDAKHVAYLRAVPRDPLSDEDGAPWSELHLVDLASGRERAFISGEVNVSALAWLPDSSAVTFLAKRGRDEDPSLYSIAIDGGEARRLLTAEGGIRAYDLSPDGGRAAFIAGPAKDKAREDLRKKGFRQEVYEEDGQSTRLMVGELGGEARALPFEGHLYQVRWSPVDERLLVAFAPTPLVDDQYMRQRVAVVDPREGTVLERFENPGKLGDILWSPDGGHIAIVSAADIHDPDAGRLFVAPAKGGAWTDLLPDYPGDVEAVAWQDADTLMYIASQGVWTALEKVELGKPARPASILASGGPILTAFSLSADGQRGAFVGDAPAHPAELFVMSHGEAAPRRLTTSNPWLAELRMAPQEVVKFQARDGLEIEGILIHPLEREPGKRYPLILNVHGGPEAHHSNGWLTSYGAPGQLGAARGFAVLYTNYRGSTGRGVAFSKLSQGDPAGKEFDDLIDAADHLIETGLVDAAKVGVTGGSYGGYATGWLSTRYSDRIAAGVMFVGISNKISKVGTTDIPGEEFYVHARKRPWDNWQLFLERSPIYHAPQAHTPLLILHGKDDPRVDPGQSRELYRHLKLHGKAPVRLVLYPGEGHGNRKAAARLDYNLRMLQWFEHYLQGPGGEMPPYELEYPAKEAPERGSAVPATAGNGR